MALGMTIPSAAGDMEKVAQALLMRVETDTTLWKAVCHLLLKLKGAPRAVPVSWPVWLCGTFFSSAPSTAVCPAESPGWPFLSALPGLLLPSKPPCGESQPHLLEDFLPSGPHWLSPPQGLTFHQAGLPSSHFLTTDSRRRGGAGTVA